MGRFGSLNKYQTHLTSVLGGTAWQGFKSLTQQCINVSFGCQREEGVAFSVSPGNFETQGARTEFSLTLTVILFIL